EKASKLKQYQQFVNELDETRGLIGVKQGEVGKYEAQKDQYDQQICQRESLIKESARRHNIRGFDLDITDDKASEFMERIGKMARDQNLAFERARRETEEKLQEAQKVLNQHSERKSALNSNKDNAKSHLSANDRKMVSIQTSLDAIEMNEGEKSVLESSVEDL